ncbi:MAG TPA: magnesium/cobalt transporter CorA [Pirellulaceae bacterium]|jgi:magnesium transporter|nr:magnesium/cobalt transporter CorA [Pirellulaceae bacterium]
MFRTLEVGPQGPVNEYRGGEKVRPTAPDHVVWIDVEAHAPEDLALLGERFGFHPLALEDCAHFDQRPKVETYDDYLFVVTHGYRFSADDRDSIEGLELHSFVGVNYLVTVHTEPMPALDAVWSRVAKEPGALRRGVAFVGYLVADATVDTFFPLVDDIADRVETIEARVVEQGDRGDRHDLEEIFKLKRSLVELRRILAPQRDVFGMLAKRGDGRIDDRTAIYFRDVHDHILRIHESVEATRDLLGNALEAYLWAASQRTNEIMKRLTLLSAIFLPLTFITGFFGQNFQHMPWGNDYLLFAMIALCLIVPTAMGFFFMRRGWI